MPILFDNQADTSNVAIPDVVVAPVQKVCLKTNQQINVSLDGEHYMILKRGCVTLSSIGTYSFEVQEDCCNGSPIVMTVSEVAAPAPPPAAGEDCDNPAFVSLCELQDLLDGLTAIQTAIEDQVDYEIITSSWICDEGGTGNWIRTITPYIDGVAGADQIINSGIPCEEPAPIDYDIEQIQYCNASTDTLWVRVSRFVTVGGVTTEEILSDIDSGIACVQPQYITKEVALCNDQGSWCVMYLFTTDDLTTPVDTVFFNPDGVISPDPSDLVSCDCEELGTLGTILDWSAITNPVSNVGQAGS